MLHKKAKEESSRIDKGSLIKKKEQLEKEKEVLEVKLKQTEEDKKQLKLLENRFEVYESHKGRTRESLSVAEKDISVDGIGRSDFGDGEDGSAEYIVELEGRRDQLEKAYKAGSGVALAEFNNLTEKLTTLKRVRDRDIKAQTKTNEVSNAITKLKEKIEADEDYTSSAKKNTKERTELLRIESAVMDIQIDKSEQITELNEKRELVQRKLDIGKDTAKTVKNAGNISKFGDEDSEVRGFNQTQKDYNKGNISNQIDKINKAAEDGIQSADFSPILEAFRSIKGSMDTGNKEGVKAVNGIIETVQKNQKRYAELTAESIKLHGEVIQKVNKQAREIANMRRLLASQSAKQ